MFLRKIANWMSYNQELKSSEELIPVDEYLNENPKAFAGGKSSGGVLSTPSLGGETSVLDFFYDNISSDTEKRKFTNCGDQKRFQPSFERVCEEEEEEEGPKDKSFEYNPFEIKEEPSDEYQLIVRSAVLGQKGNRRSDQIKTGCEDLTASSESANKTYQTTPFCQDTSASNRQVCATRNTSANSKRNIFTQTDKVAKRRSSTMLKKPSQLTLPPLPVFERKSKTFTLSRMATNVSFSPRYGDSLEHATESAVYGTLFVFGCNGAVPAHMIGSMGSKFILRKRLKANGVKEAFSFRKPDDEPTNISPAKHVISYPVSDSHSIIVAFKHDKMTDMFQIGRYEKPPIDFKVSDTNGSDRARNGVSRFACRVLVRRDETHEARIYAAAFDSSQSIFLGESGLTWKQQGKMDGFTTNGVLVMHPKENFPCLWREVSVCGFIYPLRNQKTPITRRPRIYEETNVLQDGTLIDLCGVTLLWRTTEGLRKTPNVEYLRRLQSTLHKEIPECQLLTYALPRDAANWATKKAYVYLSCGHVIGLVLSKVPENLKGWSCPICRVIGPITELAIGSESGFYMDREFPAYAFRPCGHAASLKTVEYWSSIKIPDHRSIQDSLCPFCGVKLNYIHQFIKLTLPTR